MGIDETEKKYIDNLNRLGDAGSQCEYLMMLGLKWQAEAGIKADRYRLGGCKTVIWFHTEVRQDTVWFNGDSDSLLVRGIFEILREMYNGRCLEGIRGHPPGFLEYISDDVIYPEIKQNGISICYRRLALANESNNKG